MWRANRLSHPKRFWTDFRQALMKLNRKSWTKLVRGLLSLSVLLGICAMVFPLPIAPLPQDLQEKDSPAPFPCQNRPCGCQSAEQCWKKCCCFDNSQKIAWAKANNVTESGPNKPIRVRVVFEEKPLANARVTFIPRGQQLAEGFDEKFERRTDDKGVVEFTPTEANLILVAVHHQEPERSGEGYDSTYYSATLTVAVPEVPFLTPAATTSVAK